MRLIPVESDNSTHLKLLWDLLEQRPRIASVSHKTMPTWKEHCAFVAAHPYHDWRLIQIGSSPLEPTWGALVGSAFISQPARPSVVGDELSVDLLVPFRGRGYAEAALRMMMELHPRDRYVANVAPTNYASMALFQKLGFSLCQFTFEKEK